LVRAAPRPAAGEGDGDPSGVDKCTVSPYKHSICTVRLQVIRELAAVNAKMEVQESKLETLLEERERILMNSAVAEVNLLKVRVN
jgi:hypothetical protein